jgi:MFS transporter, DHA1 family, staphyloferrin A biosynthesis exporter
MVDTARPVTSDRIAGPMAPAEAVPAAPGAGPEAAGAPPAGGGLQAFRALRHRDFRLLWFGSFFSGSGMWIQQATIGWLTYDLTGSGLLLGAANGFRSLPLLLLGPLAGVAADRLDRKRLMQTTQACNVLLTAGFATLIVTGHLQVWQIFVFSALAGVGWAFNMPVRHSVIPNLVPRQDLMSAMALMSAGFNSSRILGPTVAGLMIATLGAGENFYLQSASYLVVFLLVAFTNIPSVARAAGGSVRSSLREGGAFIWRHPTLRVQICLALVPTVVALPYSALLPIFASDVLEVGPEGFGLLSAAPGLGAVVGTLAVASADNIRRKGLLLLGSIFALGVCLALFALSRSFPISLLLLVVVGGLQMVYLTTNQTLIQTSTPDELRGRVIGVYMLNQGLLPLGTLLAGALADALSAPTAVVIMGTIVSALALVFATRAHALRAS